MLTKENYEAWKQEYEKGISTNADRIMFETFEALKEVAKAAQFAKYMAASHLDKALNEQLKILHSALDEIPDWIG